MDYVDRSFGRTFFTPLQERIRSLPSEFTKRYSLAFPKVTITRKIKVLFLLSASAIFGICAHRLNNHEAEIRWNQTHQPSRSVWIASFAAEGFRAISNPTEIARISKSLPTLSDTRGKIWGSSPDWWAIEASDTDAPVVFCLKCDLRVLPKIWESYGSGWEGWELTMKQAHFEAGEVARSAQISQKLLEKPDPREIRY